MARSALDCSRDFFVSLQMPNARQMWAIPAISIYLGGFCATTLVPDARCVESTSQNTKEQASFHGLAGRAEWQLEERSNVIFHIPDARHRRKSLFLVARASVNYFGVADGFEKFQIRTVHSAHFCLGAQGLFIVALDHAPRVGDLRIRIGLKRLHTLASKGSELLQECKSYSRNCWRERKAVCAIDASGSFYFSRGERRRYVPVTNIH